jgi:hypothetical protein
MNVIWSEAAPQYAPLTPFAVPPSTNHTPFAFHRGSTLRIVNTSLSLRGRTRTCRTEVNGASSDLSQRRSLNLINLLLDLERGHPLRVRDPVSRQCA